jgi:hypothetical protein
MVEQILCPKCDTGTIERLPAPHDYGPLDTRSWTHPAFNWACDHCGNLYTTDFLEDQGLLPPEAP